MNVRHHFTNVNPGMMAIYIGLGWFAIGFGFLFLIPHIVNYEGLTPHEKITVAHSDHVELVSVDFNFITVYQPESLSIHYVIHPNPNKPGFVAIVLPYDGQLDPIHDNWQSKKFSSGSTIIYKNFTCNTEPCSFYDGDLNFNLHGTIEAFRIPNQYVEIPLANNPLDSNIVDFINELRANGTSFSFGWKNISSEVKVTIPKEFDERETQPIGKILSPPDPSTANYIVIDWKNDFDNPLFTAKYSRDNDRSFSETRQTMIGFSMGSGISMLIAGVALRQGEESQRSLEKFVRVQRYMQDANTSLGFKNYENAKNLYELAIKINPKDIEPMILVGNLFYEMKRYDDAITYYERILKIEPKHIGALNNIGACIAGLGRHDDAIKYYEQALDVNPNHRDSIGNMGASILDFQKMQNLFLINL